VCVSDYLWLIRGERVVRAKAELGSAVQCWAMIRRRIISFASLLSLLLCVATVGLWIWSCYRGDSVEYFRGNQWFYLESAGGRLRIEWRSHWAWASNYFFEAHSWEVYTDPLVWRGLAKGETPSAFDFSYRSAHSQTFLALMIPTWLLALLTGLPGCMGSRAFWKRRRKAGVCRGCGYNLTGNVSGVCPECGEKVITVKSGAG